MIAYTDDGGQVEFTAFSVPVADIDRALSRDRNLTVRWAEAELYRYMYEQVEADEQDTLR
ncbi:MAG: hypothetical protein WBQ43_02765 [Terriglobales bacterium]